MNAKQRRMLAPLILAASSTEELHRTASVKRMSAQDVREAGLVKDELEKREEAGGFYVGQEVERCSDRSFFTNHRAVHVCFGKVERLTPTLIIVRNEHGNICRFRRADAKQVGYSYPHFTDFLRARA